MIFNDIQIVDQSETCEGIEGGNFTNILDQRWGGIIDKGCDCVNASGESNHIERKLLKTSCTSFQLQMGCEIYENNKVDPIEIENIFGKKICKKFMDQ